MASPTNPIPDLESLRRELPELPTRQRLALRLQVVNKMTQEAIAQTMGITQSVVSGTHLSGAYETLGIVKTVRSGGNVDKNSERLRDQQLAQGRKAFESVPLTPDEQEVLDEAKRRAIRQEPKASEAKNQNNQAIPTPPVQVQTDPTSAPTTPIPEGLGQIRNATSQQTPPPRPTSPGRNIWPLVAAGASLLIGGIALGSLFNRPTPASVVVQSPTPGPTQTARVEVIENVIQSTIQVPMTVAVRETVQVIQTVIVPQTVVVKQTEFVTVTQLVTVTAPVPEGGTSAEVQTPTIPLSGALQGDLSTPAPLLTLTSTNQNPNDTPVGSVLNVGETWIQGNLEVEVRNVSFVVACQGNSMFAFELNIRNKTGSELVMNMGSGDITIFDDAGREYRDIWFSGGARRDGCYSDQIGGFSIRSMPLADAQLYTFRIYGDLRSDTTSFNVKIKNAGRVKDANWIVPVPR